MSLVQFTKSIDQRLIVIRAEDICTFEELSGYKTDERDDNGQPVGELITMTRISTDLDHMKILDVSETFDEVKHRVAVARRNWDD